MIAAAQIASIHPELRFMTSPFGMASCFEWLANRFTQADSLRLAGRILVVNDALHRGGEHLTWAYENDDVNEGAQLFAWNDVGHGAYYPFPDAMTVCVP
jgi:hypothetical protein